MGELINTEGTGLINLLHGKGKDIVIPNPYEREIFLFDTYIAGTTHIEGIGELAKHMKLDDRLTFYREPNNEYDDMAIVIKNADGVKLGYVPRKDNVVFARLMDAGKLLFGKISDMEEKGKWIKIDIKVYLKE